MLVDYSDSETEEEIDGQEHEFLTTVAETEDMSPMQEFLDSSLESELDLSLDSSTYDSEGDRQTPEPEAGHIILPEPVLARVPEEPKYKIVRVSGNCHYNLKCFNIILSN